MCKVLCAKFFLLPNLKRGEKGRFPERAAGHPLKPHLLHPHLRQPNKCLPWSTFFRKEKRAQRLSFWVRRPPGGVGAPPREGVVAEKFVLSLESLSSLVFEERNLGYPENFAGMSRTKSLCKKSSCSFFVP